MEREMKEKTDHDERGYNVGAAREWHTIAYWDDMHKKILKKYQPYCRHRDTKEYIFRMSQ